MEDKKIALISEILRINIEFRHIISEIKIYSSLFLILYFHLLLLILYFNGILNF